MINYLIQSSLAWGLLYFIYWGFLEGTTFYRLNRYYLLASLGLGLILPYACQKYPGLGFSPTSSFDLPTVWVGWQDLAAQAPIASSTGGFPWLGALYTLGLLLMLSRFGYAIFQISALRKEAERLPGQGYELLLSNSTTTPFSFFKWLFWNPKVDPETSNGKPMRLHEEAHIKEWHSLDVLFLEVLQIIFWFNPIIYLYKRAIKNVHEFQADAAVLQHMSIRPYGQLLLYQARYNDSELLLVNHFFSKQIKKRIHMMTKQNSTRSRLLGYALILPAVFMMVLLFTDKQAQAEPLSDTGSSIFERITDPDEMPVYGDCSDATDAKSKKKCSNTNLINFIVKEMKYPAAAKKAGTEGMAVVSFTINKKGKVVDASIVKDVGNGCGEEALRVVKTLKTWTPGQKDGKAVNVEMKLPFQFKLDDKDKK